MKWTIAIFLVIADFVLLAMGSNLIWKLRDQGYTNISPSIGIVALRHFVGFYPFGLALFLFSAVLLAAWLIYPWPPRMSETEPPNHTIAKADTR